MNGFAYIQNEKNLKAMKMDLPVFFIAGEADPVGEYGKGVLHTAEMFRKVGMKQVDAKLYPDARHDVHNELNKEEVRDDVRNWIFRVVN